MTTVSTNLAKLFTECCLSVPRSNGAVEGPHRSAGSAKPHAHHGPLQRLLAGSPLAFSPQARIACRVQHCRHDDMRFREDVEHAERKPLYKRAAELAAHKTKRHWIGFDAAERRVHFFNEPRTEALMLLVVTPSKPLNRPLPRREQLVSASPSALKPSTDLLPRGSLRRILFKSGKAAI